ncbi:MAG TPA: glycosyltransferase family 4 protein [Opitutaceae bacterium]|nr:glycosyltransferase family 4 protein [Opitutaceae bacterium]
MSVVLFHSSVAPPNQQAARAMFEAGQLDRLVTTVRDDPRSLLQRSVTSLSRLTGRNLSSKFGRRAVTEVPFDKVVSYPMGELLRLATGAVDKDGRLTDFVWERTELGFDRKVARNLPAGITGVYGYEHSSLFTFQKARHLGLKVAYEVPAPETRYSKSILDAEMAKFPELRTAYHHYTEKREDRRVARRLAEWELADLVVAASSFTKNSFSAMGLDAAKVRIVPLGAPPVAPKDEALGRGRPIDRPLRVIWAGTFGIRKGGHYVLDAWRKGQFGRHASLKIFGTVALPESVLANLPVGIEFGGAVSRAELMAHFQDSDVLLFPTLCDGWGMNVTEAWSRGLPVMTTDRAGASELLRSGENGMLVKAASADAIVEGLNWCLSNRIELAAMREPAFATAAGWQWSDYRRRHVAVMREAGMFG